MTYAAANNMSRDKGEAGVCT